MTVRLSSRAFRLACASASSLSLIFLGVQQASPAAAAAPTVSSSFSNPLVNGYGADPSMAYYNGAYYLLYNQGVSNKVTMRKATSLAGLRSAPNITVYNADANTQCCDVGFGGFLFHDDGHWYIYDAGDDGNVNDSVQFVLESSGDDPLGPYVFKASFSGGPGPHDSGYAINAFSVNGQLYATSTSNGDGTAYNSIYIATMSNPWTLSSGWSLIAEPASSGWECADSRCIDEGGSVLVKGSTIYALFSAGGYESPDYCSGLLTAPVSSDLLDQASWTKSTGCVLARNDTAGVYGPGSTTWFTAPDGTPWIVYHVKTTDVNDSSGSDRVLEARPVTFDGSGNPDFGAPSGINTWQALPGSDPGYPAWEAENAIVTDADVRTNSSASNGGYVGGIDNSDSAVSFQVSEPTAGAYSFNVYFDNAWTSTATQTLTVNGGSPQTVSYPITGSTWGAFASANFVTVTVQLSAGNNAMTFTHSTNYAELDRIEPVAPAYYQAEDATITDAQVRNTTSAMGGSYVGGIDYSDSSVQFDNVVVPATGSYTIRVYFDNGWTSTATHNLSANGGSPVAVNYPITGSWASFSDTLFATAVVSLNAGVNTLTFAKGDNYAELDAILIT